MGKVLNHPDASCWQRITVMNTGVNLRREGHGAPLVLIDGSLAFRADGPFTGELADHFEVISIRLPGFGDDALPEWVDSIDDMAHFVLALLRRLDLTDVVLVGASFGGWVATEAATMEPSQFSHLILIDPFGVKIEPADRLAAADIYAISRTELDELLYHDPERFRFDSSGSGDRALERMARSWETMALLGWEPFFHNPKLVHRLSELDVPMLVLRGDADGLISRDHAEGFAGLSRLGTFQEIGKAGHLPLLEQPTATTAGVTAFANVSRPRPGPKRLLRA